MLAMAPKIKYSWFCRMAVKAMTIRMVPSSGQYKCLPNLFMMGKFVVCCCALGLYPQSKYINN